MKYIIELEKIKGTDLYKAKGAKTLVFDNEGIKNILTKYHEPTEHDGCVGCVYDATDDDECKSCKHNYTDKYTRITIIRISTLG